MTFNAGTKLGSYEIVGPLGAGGMGEVYRARDSKLKREVAIKVLPDAFARDAERIARFQREAEVLASLNHPHIAAIHDLAHVGESRFLVLELVEGETLAARIARGPIPMDEALGIAKQISEALEAAHEKGIIHRDLKPANIKLAPGGNVKVLDFGLAKVREAETGASLSNSPTLMTVTSTPGLILGTAAYMSPEQAKGKEADRTADVWAFGCVLYEMLTGHAVFEGDTMGEILGGIFKAEPDWNRLPPETPVAIRRLLRRCLQKERRLRLRDAGDACIEIEEAQSRPGGESDRPKKGSSARERLAWISVLVLLAFIGAGAVVFVWRGAPSAPPEMRVDITAPPSTDPTSLAISPDGSKIAFVANSEGRPRLWLRSLDSIAARPLPGTDFASYPFWSPDSRSIGFFGDSKLKRIDIDGGSLQTLTNAPAPFGRGAWNRDGVILFVSNPSSAVLRISATGGAVTAVTRLNPPQQTAHFGPLFLSDGRHFLYEAAGSPDATGIYIGDLDGSETQRLFDGSVTTPVLASSGHLLFVRQGTLFAQNFNLDRFALTGDPFPVAQQVLVGVRAALSASAAGPIIFRSGSSIAAQRQLIWFDRFGKEIAKVGEPDSSMISPSLSTDGRRVAMFRSLVGNNDVWVLELSRNVLSRLTFDGTNNIFPIWSPDGGRIAFSSSRKGFNDLYLKSMTGAGAEEVLLQTARTKVPTDWSPNGRFLLYRDSDPKTGFDIWALPLDGDRRPFPLVQTDFEERNGQFSPDGKWIAYQSNESGRFEIYAQPFPGPGGKLQISTTGGAQVRWPRDGKELFYIALDGRLMSVPIRFPSSGQAEPGSPVPLFATRLPVSVQDVSGHQYVVSPDGQRFLINTATEDTNASPITVILNWQPKP